MWRSVLSPPPCAHAQPLPAETQLSRRTRGGGGASGLPSTPSLPWSDWVRFLVQRCVKVQSLFLSRGFRAKLQVVGLGVFFWFHTPPLSSECKSTQRPLPGCPGAFGGNT